MKFVALNPRSLDYVIYSLTALAVISASEATFLPNERK